MKLSRSEYQKQWRERNPDYGKEYKKAYKKNHPEKYKRWFKDNKERYYASIKKYKEANPEKVAARQQLNLAVRHGEVVRPDFCSSCGVKCRVDGDHHDYSKPLDVTWLCRQCHANVTMRRKSAIIKT